MSLVCTRMSFVCHSYILVCHSYVTPMYSYVIRMSLFCGFTMNRFWSMISEVTVPKNSRLKNNHRPSLFSQQHSVEWFLLRRFVDLLRVCSLLIINRNYTNTFLLIILQKNLSKVNRIAMSFYTGFRPLLNVFCSLLMSSVCHSYVVLPWTFRNCPVFANIYLVFY